MKQIRVRAGDPNLEEVEIVIEGWNRKREPIAPMAFRCLPEVQGTAILQAFQALDTKSEEAVYSFLRSALEPEEEERFNQIIHGKDVIVNFQRLMDLLQDLVEHYSENPSQRPSDLPNMQSTTAPTSAPGVTGLVAPNQQPWMPPTFAEQSTPS